MILTKRKARKDHRCVLCGKTIERGAHYMTRRLPPKDGGWDTYKAHIECDNYWYKVWMQWDEMWPGDRGYGDEFLEYMQEAMTNANRV